MNASEIKVALNNRAEEFAQWLFPAGRRHNNQWQVGSLDGEAGRSLSICVSGTKVGLFKDFATDDVGANLVELYMQARQVSFKEALRSCGEWLGVGVTYLTPETRPRARCKPRAIPDRVPMMPESVQLAWKEGTDYLKDRPELVISLAKFRGWPVHFVQHLIDVGVISLPRQYNERGVAFLVEVLEEEPGSLTVRPVGYHIRLRAHPPSDKPSWCFAPNQKEHKQGIPALPFILGEFQTARLLVITEGQWDSLSVALAAGWLGQDGNFPAAVGIVGIRGVSGVNTFLRHYRRFWPRDANCLVLADSDEAGAAWYTGESCFAAELAKICRKVAVVTCTPHKDFNDLYRAQMPGPEVINELLATHGMAIESEVVS